MEKETSEYIINLCDCKVDITPTICMLSVDIESKALKTKALQALRGTISRYLPNQDDKLTKDMVKYFAVSLNQSDEFRQ